MKYSNFLYNWTLKKASHRNASWILAFVSFIESFIFPIPPDIILIPMVLSKKEKALRNAFICSVSSVLGAMIGYLIGFLLYDNVGKIIIETYNLSNNFNTYKNYYDKFGIWIILFGGFTPFPYKLITIASGLFALNFPLFIVFSLISRSLRFFIIAFLLLYFGPKIKIFVETNFGKLTFIFFFLLILSYALIKLI